MSYLKQWWNDVIDGWNRFWFSPTDPHTLGLIRILAGSMLLYTHLVWAVDLKSFFGPDAWLPTDAARQWSGWFWTPLWHLRSMPLIWVFHLVGMAIIAAATIGYKTRITSKLAWLVALAYVHRMHGALFGLDQVNIMLAMYLAVGPSGDAYSLDNFLASRRGEEVEPLATTGANLAIRLMQVHLCVVYLFGGIGKTQGATWWEGTAVWYAAASYEYQSLSLTWLVHSPLLVATLSHFTTFWETFYCALVWPRITRPLALAAAVGVHGGIALFLGMITFGVAMIIANVAFIPSHITRQCLERLRK